MLFALCVLWTLAVVTEQVIFAAIASLGLLLMLVQVLDDLVHGRFRPTKWCGNGQHCYQSRKLLYRITTRTLEQQELIVNNIDSDFVVSGTLRSDDWVILGSSQLVCDGFMIEGEVPRHIRHCKLGSIFSFRQYILDATDIFIEIHCGGFPVQICVNALCCFGWCILCVAIMVMTRYFHLFIVCYLGGVSVFLTPAICVFVAPRLAAKAHFIVCIGFSVMGTLLGMAASRPSSLVFWFLPLLCVSSHCLLRRRFHSRMVVTASIGLISAFVVAFFFSQSVGAAFPEPFRENNLQSNTTFTFDINGTHNPFPGPAGLIIPVCRLGYHTSDPKLDLSLIDFGFFSKAAYETDDVIEDQLEQWMSQWVLVKSVRRETRGECHGDCPSRDWTSWFVFEGKKGRLKDTTVVTIRGTKSILETFFVFDLWSLDWLGSTSFAGRFAGVGHVVESVWTSKTFGRLYYRWKRERYSSVYEYLKGRLQNEPTRVFYITGHSLGGSIAQIISAQIASDIPSSNLAAIAFSAPGVTETISKLGFEPESLQGHAVNLIPDKDPIPWTAGGQPGVNFMMPCIDNGLRCHRMFNTICELMRECGDPHGRILPCGFCPLQAWELFEIGKADQCANIHTQYIDSEERDQAPWDTHQASRNTRGWSSFSISRLGRLVSASRGFTSHWTQ
jgi:hypothetical protein